MCLYDEFCWLLLCIIFSCLKTEGWRNTRVTSGGERRGRRGRSSNHALIHIVAMSRSNLKLYWHTFDKMWEMAWVRVSTQKREDQPTSDTDVETAFCVLSNVFTGIILEIHMCS